MTWEDLAFLHWPVPFEALRKLIPPALTLDRYEGNAWLGITPFRMEGVRPRLAPAMPGLSSFPELNVRTYVTAEGKPGIWFFSLDADNRLAVRAARLLYGLPYHAARMAMRKTEDGGVHYRSRRLPSEDAEASFTADYRPLGPVFEAESGSLEHWLTERYCLYAERGGRCLRGEILHSPWPLQAGAVHIETNTMTTALGIEPPSAPPLVHFARRLDVVAWLPEAVGG